MNNIRHGDLLLYEVKNLPKNLITDDTPISTSEKLVKEDIKKLTQNSEDIRKLKEQVDKNNEEKSE